MTVTQCPKCIDIALCLHSGDVLCDTGRGGGGVWTERDRSHTPHHQHRTTGDQTEGELEPPDLEHRTLEWLSWVETWWCSRVEGLTKWTEYTLS